MVETVAPTGHDLPNPAFQHVTVVADETVDGDLRRPASAWCDPAHQDREARRAVNGVRPHAGVDFTIAGTPVTTDVNGQACVDGLLFGDYDVVETVPAGYVADGDTTKSVTVDNAATCDDDPYGGETVSFSNTPLTNVTVTVDSQIEGGTASTIDCVVGRCRDRSSDRRREPGPHRPGSDRRWSVRSSSIRDSYQ